MPVMSDKVVDMKMSDGIVYQGEMQLAGWSESHTGGAKVVLWLSDPSELDAFRRLTARKGNQAGQRLACVFVEIGDDEQPVAQKKESVLKGGALSKLAGLWCQAPQFQEWIVERFPDEAAVAAAGIEGAGDDEIAAAIVRHVCGVKRRAELDHSETARDLFNAHIRYPFMDEQPL